jgi:hypothetical protein
MDVRRPFFVGAGHGSLQDWGVTGTEACFVDVVSRSARRYDQKKRHGSDVDAMNGFHALISVARSDRGRSAVATSFIDRPCHLVIGTRKV